MPLKFRSTSYPIVNKYQEPYLIYFDSAASYPILPEVEETLIDAFSQIYGNSTASHLAGIEASDSVERVRDLFADTIGSFSSEVVFTSGATESNNIAFKSILLGNPEFDEKRHIVTSTIEHKCILVICSYLESIGFKITYIKPNINGLITKNAVEQSIRPDTALVSIMHVNNELGTINPIGEIGALCFSKGVLFHVDAAQSFLKLPIDVDEMNIDLLSVSAHKVGGPKGIGAIYIRDLRKRLLLPVIHGAGQEEGLRGGTVAAPLIKAFGGAIQTFPEYYEIVKTTNLKQYLSSELNSANVNFFINGDPQSTLLSICSVTLPHSDVGLLIRATESQFCLAQGSACSSQEIEPSHVLTSLGLKNDMAEKTLRLSFSHFNSTGEVDLLVKRLTSL
jgi:cysteine desulfurase